MNCYVCEEVGSVGGTRYGTRAAVGVCHDCGIGLCRAHAHRPEPGSPLRCGGCAAHARIPVSAIYPTGVTHAALAGHSVPTGPASGGGA